MSRPPTELGHPTEPRGRIPAFESVEEEAAFWDTHDVTDYLDKSHPVDITVGRELAGRLTLRLEQADRDELARRAGAMGIGPSTLVRMWIKERLRPEAEADASPQ